jgi:hypothetical protein
MDANGNLYQSDVSHTRINPGDKGGGFIFHFGPEGGKRTVFLRVGSAPTFMAFWPASNTATKSKIK